MAPRLIDFVQRISTHRKHHAKRRRSVARILPTAGEVLETRQMMSITSLTAEITAPNDPSDTEFASGETATVTGSLTINDPYLSSRLYNLTGQIEFLTPDATVFHLTRRICLANST